MLRVGEGHAYWSLGNAYTSLGDFKQARHFSAKHLQVAAEIGDSEAVDTARRNVADLDNRLQLQDKSVPIKKIHLCRHTSLLL